MCRPVVALAVLAAVPCTSLRPQTLDSLRAAVVRRIAGSGATVAVYYRDLVTVDSLGIDPDARFHAASTMKVAVMVQVHRDADSGVLRLTDALPVTTTFRSLADGSPFTLSAADDSDSSLYRVVGRPVRIGELLHRMITVSSNVATNLLVERVQASRIQATLRELGADSMTVLRGVEDGAAYRAGLNNTTTARALGVLFAAIAEGRAARARSCAVMLDVLRGQRFRDGIPAGLPRGTRVAHKTGEITSLHHDAGIVYVRGRPRYVLVVLTRGLADRTASAALIADIARLVHAHASPESRP